MRDDVAGIEYRISGDVVSLDESKHRVTIACPWDPDDAITISGIALLELAKAGSWGLKVVSACRTPRERDGASPQDG
jgi:hypothetical protein